MISRLLRALSSKLKVSVLVLGLLGAQVVSASAPFAQSRVFADTASPLYYTGQGSTLDKQCDANNTPYLLFIFSYGGNYSPTNVTLHGISVTSYQQNGNETQITTAYEDPSSLINPDTVYVTWDGTVGNAQLVISHGCPGSSITPVQPTLTTQVSSSSVHVGDTVKDVATLVGTQTNGDVTGTVDFYLCGPDVSTNPDCSTGGTQVGGDVTVNNGQATSAGYQVAAAGDYCFRAEYTPDISANYLAVTHTNLTTECFTATELPGTITVTKVVDNNHGGTATASEFPLYVNSTQVTSGATNVFATGQSYTVSENGGPSGYTQISLTCTDAAGTSLGATFTLAAGENVSCTIINADVAPQLTVIKHVVNGYGGTAQASDFTMGVTGTNVSNSSFPGSETGTTVTLNVGTYSVGESGGPAGYTASLSADCSGTIAVGETKICTITNTQQPASISGHKYEVDADATQGSGGTPVQSWTIYLLLNGSPIAHTTTDANGNYSFTGLNWGNYTLAECLNVSDNCSGWTQIYGPSAVTVNGTQQTSTNNDFGNFKNATIKGYKWNDENGDGKHQSGEPKLQGWTIDLYNSSGKLLDSDVTDANGNYEFDNIAPGKYKVCEVQQSGWVQTYPGTKDGCHSLTVKKSGHTYTENFGNQGHGTITVTKYLFPSNDSGLFDLTVDGQAQAINIGDLGTTGAVDVTAGTHYVGELAGTGTDLSDYDSFYICYENGQFDILGDDSGTTSNDFTVNPGESVQCNFYNYRHASLTIIKKAYPFGTSQAFTFDLSQVNEDEDIANQTTPLKTFQLDDNNDPTLSNTNTSSLSAGIYTVTEESTAGWNLVGIDCGSAQVTVSGATVTVGLASGQQVTCTYTNQMPVVPQVLGASTSTPPAHLAELTNTGLPVLAYTLAALSLMGMAVVVFRKSTTSN